MLAKKKSGSGYNFRSSKSGRFVKKPYADKHPRSLSSPMRQLGREFSVQAPRF